MPDRVASPIQEVCVNPIRVDATNSSDFSADGLVVRNPHGILVSLGYADVTGISARLPTLHHGGVQTAATGVIQDPAGSAIGSGEKPSGGGAAGAIYARFPDLLPIDTIAPRSAIFNRSTGPGRRVLHTHSPALSGDPSHAEQRNSALGDLANSYYNAVVAVDRRAGVLGDRGELLNLVPVSASIYARAFANRKYRSPHLDPSYTLTAIMVAVGELLKRSEPIMELTLYVFSPDTYQETVNVATRLKSAT